ncbi:hypothetical protein KGM_211740 [Danaus plexippus plexippus]|uniref:Uncharacterized protein n=1 Tax=Danaus plexippus plexippus TaxID=278856 RepID=A0A212FPJ0_DANPL|nr:hypothetical protein KGM_211740 [Danaus plexippus plexippus]
MNSLVIVLFLSGMVAMILLRTLHKDIARYNQMECGEDAQVWHVNAFVCIKKLMLPPRKIIIFAFNVVKLSCSLFFHKKYD